METLIAVNADCGTITMSHSLAALWAMNRRRPSAVVAEDPSSTLAAGYHCLASRPTCSMMWLGGTTIQGWRTSPRRPNSIAEISMVPVLPAPTTWSRRVAGSLMIRATALR